MSAITLKLRPLAELQAEVDQYCHAMGWREDPPVFPDCMALLHEEVSEAGSAWRHWGLNDVTGEAFDGMLSKPEGVGSEFADFFIRLLDDCELFGVDLPEELRYKHGLFGISESFLTNMNTLHVFVSRTMTLWELDDPGWRTMFGALFVFLAQLAEHYGIDLQAEYDRKMAFNRTRPYRHGNKRR